MFVRGGYAIPGNYLYYAGDRSYYWSSVGLSSSTAYILTFRSAVVFPSGDGYRYNGQSVRCVALGG